MKKLFKFIAVLLTASLLFVSCSDSAAPKGDIQVGENRYSTMQEAVNAVNSSSEVITLLADYTDSGFTVNDKEVSINLGTYNYKVTSSIKANDCGDIIIEASNGSITSENKTEPLFVLTDSSSVTFGRFVNVKAPIVFEAQDSIINFSELSEYVHYMGNVEGNVILTDNSIMELDSLLANYKIPVLTVNDSSFIQILNSAAVSDLIIGSVTGSSTKHVICTDEDLFASAKSLTLSLPAGIEVHKHNVVEKTDDTYISYCCGDPKDEKCPAQRIYESYKTKIIEDSPACISLHTDGKSLVNIAADDYCHTVAYCLCPICGKAFKDNTSGTELTNIFSDQEPAKKVNSDYDNLVSKNNSDYEQVLSKFKPVEQTSKGGTVGTVFSIVSGIYGAITTNDFRTKLDDLTAKAISENYLIDQFGDLSQKIGELENVIKKEAALNIARDRQSKLNSLETEIKRFPINELLNLVKEENGFEKNKARLQEIVDTFWKNELVSSTESLLSDYYSNSVQTIASVYDKLCYHGFVWEHESLGFKNLLYAKDAAVLLYGYILSSYYIQYTKLYTNDNDRTYQINVLNGNIDKYFAEAKKTEHVLQRDSSIRVFQLNDTPVYLKTAVKQYNAADWLTISFSKLKMKDKKRNKTVGKFFEELFSSSKKIDANSLFDRNFYETIMRHYSGTNKNIYNILADNGFTLNGSADKLRHPEQNGYFATKVIKDYAIDTTATSAMHSKNNVVFNVKAGLKNRHVDLRLTNIVDSTSKFNLIESTFHYAHYTLGGKLEDFTRPNTYVITLEKADVK